MAADAIGGSIPALARACQRAIGKSCRAGVQDRRFLP
jgi:hypothetical protein